jgi:DNA primase
MPGLDYRQARAGVRIAEVLALMDWEATWHAGAQRRGPCPLHGSRAPTSRVFAVHLDKNVYHCFRCGAHGNALDLWCAWTEEPLHAAVVELYQRLGRAVPWYDGAAARPRPGAARGRRDRHEEGPSMHDP